VSTKDFRLIQKLSGSGLFRRGGVIIGSHAFSALGNMLGVRWMGGDLGAAADDIRAAEKLSVALPAAFKDFSHDAITSLELGLLPVRDQSWRANAGESDLAVSVVEQPSAAFLSQGAAQGVIFSKSGACAVNLPDPARFAAHCLVAYGAEANALEVKDLAVMRAAALLEWHIDQQRVQFFAEAWQDALARGPAWRRNARQGRKALVQEYSTLAICFEQS